ncbi:hypothetical protein METBIDRAFT_153648 [Metschnikowia bicuspidata var. bicuspidata NRRL YB-4993]|uniref:Presequence protease, mitochondrial n=1 Tax=Metschnikowia bicuspidata var. bicuspidata NRRL YB-4993 TaxID=869754 RepID=A0A1A0HEY5_9ASCO|nr:hypothetical protein METBIDRAFT_153648 [Metschnikowia bicuspidata var. bicuspidata NRRL YB-4993]OBA22452.1 hypothetical protein METBIDRAFT_153648 [Metschnikowia bicuspidata var. bicuspidata NRRL YB-4993]
MFRAHAPPAAARAAARTPRRCLAAAAAPAEPLALYPAGLSIHGFTVETSQNVPEFSLVAVRLRHARTGLQHVHLHAAGDTNNVFSVAFRTNAPDASGVPHILEHTTLCGSRAYPVRDPFFKMLSRSLSSFMNAMTGHDYTYYPFATTNRADFDNLLAVYLSAVFEPTLAPADFLQEGWRLEHADVADAASPLRFKGVVYNEMKGQCQSAAYLFWLRFQQAVYPQLHNAAGDPAAIVRLRHDDLLDFHAAHYHPSNAKTFTYGHLPLAPTLRKLDAQYAGFGMRARPLAVPQPVFRAAAAARACCVAGPPDAMSTRPLAEQLKASVTWDLGDALDPARAYDVFKWRALASLLFDGHNAPFYRHLIESGYAEDFLPNCGLDQTTALLSFTVGAASLSRARAAALPEKVRDILRSHVVPELAKGPASAWNARVHAIVHQLELGFKRHRPDFGLGLLHSVVPAWTNGMDPLQLLRVQPVLDRFKQEYRDRGLRMFLDLVERVLLDPATPTFHFTMVPNANYHDELAAQEDRELAARVQLLSSDDRALIFDRGQALLRKQQLPEDVSVLPTLTLHDIPRTGDRHHLDFRRSAGTGAKIQTRVRGTNGLVYVAAKKDVAFLPQPLYKYLPLFTACLTDLAGTAATPISDLETRIQLLTGGISFAVRANTDPYDLGKPTLQLVLSGMALKENAAHIYDLWREILLSTTLAADDAVLDKLTTLVKNLAQSQADTIADRGHSYASAHSNAHLTPTKHINDLLSGVGQVRLVLDMNKKLDLRGREYLSLELLPILREIQTLLTQGFVDPQNKGFSYSLVGELSAVALNELLVDSFDTHISANCRQMPDVLGSVAAGFLPSTVLRTVLNMPFQVGYASLAKLGAPYASKDGATLQALSQVMTFKHLHSVIREANGAYGGGLNFDGLGGTLNFYSYRDPNAIKSVQAFEASAQAARSYLADGLWDDKALQEAKLAIFQSVDAPSHVSSEGAALFLDGISDDMRQQRRERFLDVSVQDLQDANEKYLANGASNVYTVLGDADILGAGDDWSVKSF